MDWIKTGNIELLDQAEEVADALDTPAMRRIFELDILSTTKEGEENADDAVKNANDSAVNAKEGVENVKESADSAVVVNKKDADSPEKTDGVTPRITVRSEFGKWFDTDFMVSLGAYRNSVMDWKATGERTPHKVAALRVKRARLLTGFRKLYKILKNSLGANEENFAAMGLPWKDGNRTASQAPLTFPDAKITFPSPMEVAISVTDSASAAGKISKPAGYHGFEVLYGILGHTPTTISELTRSGFSTTSSIRLAFDISDSGKTLYFLLRWENNRAQKGPWSSWFHVTIP